MPGRGRLILAVIALVGALGAVAPNRVVAQVTNGLSVINPILRLDQDRLYRQSLFGQRVLRELEEATRTLSQENRQIEQDLSEEEKTLTRDRATMEPTAFRELADAFDGKVVDIRAAQDAKARALKAQADAEQRKFFERAIPVIAELMNEAGAVAILDSRAIVLSANSIDVTDLAIRRVDAVIGEGNDLKPKDPAGETPASPADGAKEP